MRPWGVSRRRFLAGAAAIAAAPILRAPAAAAAMHLYLAPYTTNIRPAVDGPVFAPRGNEQPGWAAIDLRRDVKVVTGRALMAVPVRDDTIGEYLGDSPDEISAAVKATIETRLGIVLQAVRPRLMIAELLMAHGRTDGTRWKPLRPSHGGFYHLFLGGRTPFWSHGPLRGGADVTETFDTAASDTLGPVLTWNELEGDWDVNASNQASCTSGTPATARADSDMASDDHYCQFVGVSLIRAGSAAGMGPICRKDGTATLTYYLWWAAIDTASNNHYLYRVDAGGLTQLGSTVLDDFVAGEVMKVEADGSTIKGYIDGVEKISVSDPTGITGNLRGGIRGYQSGGDTIVVDNVRIADLAAAGAAPQRALMGVGI